jgi:hypothetical protein
MAARDVLQVRGWANSRIVYNRPPAGLGGRIGAGQRGGAMIATQSARTSSPASHRAGVLRTGLLVALLGVQGCAGDDPSGGAESAPPPPVVATAREVDPVGGSVDATPADESAAGDPVEAERAARRAAAQSYLESALEAASERHRLALAHCRGSVDVDFETCVATADQSLEAEQRSARVEFDARMEAD